MGPLADPEVRARAAEVLPGVDLIIVREAVTGPAFLDDAGVPREHVVVASDDALELAAAGSLSHGEGLGLTLRAADYAGIGEEAIRTVSTAARRVAERLGAPLVPVPISLNPTQADTDTFTRLTGEFARAPATTQEAIAAAARCRVVVTGAYHASIFALAQGVPAVGIAASDYYRGKLGGAGRQFGYEMALLDPEDPDFEERLDEAVTAAWNTDADRREELLRSAADQVRTGRAAYERLAELVPGAQRRSSTSRS
jgi:polysaccharide pyruvyl transferase WcaK-like protein